MDNVIVRDNSIAITNEGLKGEVITQATGFSGDHVVISLIYGDSRIAECLSKEQAIAFANKILELANK